MECPNCQFENPEDAKFCNECGHSLAKSTRTPLQDLSFDEKIRKLQRYLPEGLTEKILAQKDRIEGESKHVTVMFCDMVGFTPFVERLGPEDAYLIMDEVYNILIHKVHDFEGTVNEMTGDGVMALFGAPIALEDAPQRALWSALSIQREISVFNKKKKEIGPIRMRIGIHTGPVVVGTLGNDLRVEFKAVGNTVNLASRMEELAGPETIFVSEETYRLNQALFHFEALGKRAVKGVEHPVPVYRVVSAKEDIYRPRLGSERMIYSRMVGRNRELDRLELQVMKAINGEGSVVNIIGEAGIGKSRLVAELKKRELMNRVNVLEGRAISIGRNLSFHPVIDLFKQWAQIGKDDSEAMAFRKLKASVRSLCPVEVNDVLPFMAILMGMKLPRLHAERVTGIEGEALENLILQNLRILLIRATERSPLVIVTEDLHWADTTSIELMESLFRLVETKRILFINVFRPGQKETGERIVEALREKLPEHYVKIRLEPLDERTSETLITNMLSTGLLHHSVISDIVGRTGGNPFFIEEVVRSLIDEGAVVLKNGTFEVTEEMSKKTKDIPKTIQALLMARIDRLEEPTRNLVKVASVIGRNFFYRILSEVGGTVADIDSRLTFLKEIQIIRERKRMGELEYLFKHALSQEAAYESILPQKRKELHLEVAASIEKVFADRLHEFYGMLAYHYSRAESHEKTEEYLIKAGEEALKSAASNEALHYYQEALDLYLEEYGTSADPEKVAMIEKNIAIAQYNRGHYDESLEYFDKALDYYWGGLPKSSVSSAYHLPIALLHFLISLYLPSLKFKDTPTPGDSEAIDLFFKKLKALAVIQPMKYFVESFYFYKRVTKFDLTKFDLGIGLFVGASTLFSFTGMSYKLSRKILDLVKDRADKSHLKSYIIYDFSETMHQYFEGSWKSIKPYDGELVSKNLSMGELYWTSQHFFWHGCPMHYQGRFEVVAELIDKLGELAEVYENDLAMLLRYLLNTNLLIDRGRFEDALEEIIKALDFGQKISQESIRVEMHSRKAHIHLLKSETETAEKSIRREYEDAKKALELADEARGKVKTVPWQETDFTKGQFELDLCMLRVSIKKSDTEVILENRKKAKKSARKMLKIAKKVAQNRTDAYKLMGVYCWTINKQKTALKWWQKAITEGEHLGARLELSRTYFEVGKHLLENTSKYKSLNGITAQEYIEKARILFHEMKLEWDLDEIEKLGMG
ncbi:adenylate/guanylate cyclase domain-containing protein [Thermodesulfobacteriota bacterium]